MFITIRTKEEDYIDLNVPLIAYVKHYTTKRSNFYRVYVGLVYIDITVEVYNNELEPVLYPED